MKLTADTITDDQICELRDTAWNSCNTVSEQNHIAETCNLAICGYRSAEGLAEKSKARARCAEILNARNVMDGGTGWPPDDRTPAQVAADKLAVKP